MNAKKFAHALALALIATGLFLSIATPAQAQQSVRSWYRVTTANTQNPSVAGNYNPNSMRIYVELYRNEDGTASGTATVSDLNGNVVVTLTLSGVRPQQRLTVYGNKIAFQIYHGTSESHGLVGLLKP